MSKKLLVPFGLCFALGGHDFNDSAFPSSIVLQGGLRKDTITPTKGNHQATTFGYNRDPFLDISGQAGSQYLLSINNPPNLTSGATTYYSGGFNIGSKIEFALSNVHTLAIQKGGINLQENSALTVLSSGTNINPQGSEYGGASKIRFATGTKLILAQNAQAKFHNASFFIHDGFTSLQTKATLDIEAQTIRFQKKLNNDGGRLILQGNLYLIGSPFCHNTACSTSSNTIASLTSTQGEIIINGDFYNGGIAKVDGANSIFNTFDPPFGGGGNLVLKGGKIEIEREIFSQRGGTPINGGGILDPQDSSLGLYGGIIKTKKLNNKEGSTLIFGAYEGKMGQLQGELNNTQGKIILDFSGAQGGDHQLVKGTAIPTNATQADIMLKNADTEFFNAKAIFENQHWNGWVKITIEQDAIDHFLQTLNPNEHSILKGFGDSVFTLGLDQNALQNQAKTINQSLFLNFVATPFALLSALKESSSPLPSPHRVDLKIFGEGFYGGIYGGMGGLKAMYQNLWQTSLGEIFFSAQGIYTYGNTQSSQNSPFFSIKNTSHNLGLNLELASFLIPHLEIKASGGYFASLIHSKRHINLQSNRQDFQSHHSLHQLSLELETAYHLSLPAQFSLKPYFSIIQNYNIIPSFQEIQNSQPRITQNGYKAYHLSFALGIETKYRIASKGQITLGFKTEQFAFSSQDFKMLWGGEQNHPITFKQPYQNRLDFYLKGDVSLTQELSLEFGGSLKSSLNSFKSIHSYGISGSLKYWF